MIPIVIVDYNSLKRTWMYISDCITYLEGEKLEFFVVENGNSEIYESDFLSQCSIVPLEIDPRVCYVAYCEIKSGVPCYFIKLNGNYGFAVGNNIGYRIAKTLIKGFKYVIFSNNDLVFKTKINIRHYEDIMLNDNQVALIGPKILGLDGQFQSPHRYVSLKKRWIDHFFWWPLDSFFPVLNKSNDVLVDVENCFPYRVIGAFLFLKAEMFEQVGMFDEGTFLYAEEKILSEKFSKFNLKICYDTKYTIIHEEGGTTKGCFTNQKKLREQLKSELYYYKNYKNATETQIILTKCMMEFYLFKRKVLERVKIFFI